jgi:hypothetical protein
MRYDPQQRPTASQTLQYPYFQVNIALPPPLAENTASYQMMNPTAASIANAALAAEASANADPRSLVPAAGINTGVSTYTRRPVAAEGLGESDRNVGPLMMAHKNKTVSFLFKSKICFIFLLF